MNVFHSFPISRYQVKGCTVSTTLSFHLFHSYNVTEITANLYYFEAYDDDLISTALGWIGHLAILVAYYSGIKLSYGIRSCGSRSTIRDEITYQPEPIRTEFPLFMKQTERYWFEYAIKLLQKDIEQVRTKVK